MAQYKIDAEVVMKAASGRWEEILSSLAPDLRPALAAAPKHVACPIHGGDNGFRFFKDYRETGSCICNTCGTFDGLHLLMQVNRWTFYTALKAVNDYLCVPEGTAPESACEAVEGEVLSIGIGKLRSGATCFCIKLSTSNGEKVFWGSDLRRASEQEGVSVGDNVRISRIGSKAFVYKGKECRKTLWAVKKLSSLKEREEEERREAEEAERRQRAITSTWASAKEVQPADDLQSPLVTYLTGRKIFPEDPTVLKDMRYSQAETYFDDAGRKLGRFPCMICAVRTPEGVITTLHRTFLTTKGTKVPFGPAKKLMSLPNGCTINGAAIRFGEVSKEGILCVAEGVETALSVSLGTGYPCFSTISANGMATFIPPSGVKTVFIFADKDRSTTGEKAAVHLHERLLTLGIPSVICPPCEDIPETAKGVDWNDVLRHRGHSAFPFHRR
ncbi:toprim domain-containing protein [Sutterella sp.]|uniref:toprim domain-containing protein n=1 Tax=Sutterella sp. TaxID=1981025 RepID=UPI003FD77C07